MGADHKVIYELCGRLPGPLAGRLLVDHGEKIIKIVDPEIPDPFQASNLPAETGFSFWHNSLNKDKNILDINLNEMPPTQLAKLLLTNGKGLIFQRISKNFNWDQLIESLQAIQLKDNLSFAIIELVAAKIPRPLHDINILAETGLLGLKNELPQIPLAGTFFASHIVGLFYKTQIESLHACVPIFKKAYLDECILNLTNHLLPDDAKAYLKNNELFLHLGIFPCYGLYTTKDKKHVALGAIESKYWMRFVRLFQLALDENDRFDKSKIDVLKKLFESKSASEILEIMGTQEICLSLVKKF